MPLVTPEGFADIPETVYAGLDTIEHSNEPLLAVLVPNDTDAAALAPHFEKISLLAIGFPSSHDGRGFSLAMRLRRLGYDGELRAHGNVIADQFAHALACGFDAVEIDAALAARQPEDQWRAVTARTLPPYRQRCAG